LADIEALFNGESPKSFPGWRAANCDGDLTSPPDTCLEIAAGDAEGATNPAPMKSKKLHASTKLSV
jgi:hypothetical protein